VKSRLSAPRACAISAFLRSRFGFEEISNRDVGRVTTLPLAYRLQSDDERAVSACSVSRVEEARARGLRCARGGTMVFSGLNCGHCTRRRITCSASAADLGRALLARRSC
jgi:hypothetical protein